MSSKPLFNQVTVIGLGLIGGSIARAIKRQRVARRVVGVHRKKSVLTKAKRAKAIDQGFLKIAPGVEKADLVIVATPPSSVVPVAAEVAQVTKHKFLLTDAASSKAWVVKGFQRCLPARIGAVGSHPMAGSEKKGFDASKKDLFDGALCILTRVSGNSPRAMAKVASFWKAIGMRTMTLTPKAHDEAVALVSHVPHLLAASLVSATSASEMKVAGPSYLGATRVAKGDPKLWTDICSSNRKEVLAALARFERALIHFRQAIAYNDSKELTKSLKVSQRKRAAHCCH